MADCRERSRVPGLFGGPGGRSVLFFLALFFFFSLCRLLLFTRRFTHARFTQMGKKTTSQASRNEPLELECTINLGEKLRKIAQKKRAPRATREIKKFTTALLGTKDVRMDMDLNKFIWSKGIKNVPKRVRVRLSRRLNEDDEAAESMYTLVTYIKVDTFKGLLTSIPETE